jgi:hypothetical protein
MGHTGQTYTRLSEREYILEEIAEQMATNSDGSLSPIELLEAAQDLLKVAHDLVKEAAEDASFESGPGGRHSDVNGLIQALEIRIDSEHGFMSRETSVQDLIETAHSPDDEDDEDEDEEDEEDEEDGDEDDDDEPQGTEDE